LLLAYYANAALYLILYAAIFLVVVLVLPRGIIPSLRDRLEARRGSRGVVHVEHHSVEETPPGPHEESAS
jgi:hypothetical protein